MHKNDQTIRTINAFCLSFTEMNAKLPIKTNTFPDNYEMDRFLLTDIYRILKGYERELEKNASTEQRHQKPKE